MIVDIEKEKSFVRNFIDKNFQDRLLMELQGSKRKHGIDKFSHETRKIINSKYLILKESKISPEECLSMIKKYSSSTKGYIISFESLENDVQIDGKEFELENIIYDFFYLYFGAVLIVDPHTVIIKSEYVYGPSCKYILYRKDLM